MMIDHLIYTIQKWLAKLRNIFKLSYWQLISMGTLALPILRISEQEGDKKSLETPKNSFFFIDMSIQSPFCVMLSCRYFILIDNV